MRPAIVLLIACGSATAQTPICKGNPALDALSGYYASFSVLAAAEKFKSWPQILGATYAQVAGLTVKDRDIRRSLAWHEGDEGGNCLLVHGDSITLKVKDEPKSSDGYRKIATLSEVESWAYLNLFAAGCYSATDKTQWCISKSGITIDAKPLDAKFSLDVIEQVDYGTNIMVKGSKLPFLVLAPIPNGFRVFKDTWVSDENRKPVNPHRDKPWLVLTRLK
jgi:hypothetical protein